MNMKMNTLLMTAAMTGALVELASAQAVESCYRASVDSFSPVALSGSPASLTLNFSSSTHLSGPDVGSIAGEFQFDIFGGNGLTATYDNGAVVVNGYVAGNFDPANVKVKGVKLADGWKVCSTDVKTWTMIVDDSITKKISEIESAKQEVYFGNSATKDVQKLNFGDKESDGKGGFTYRIANADLGKLSDAGTLNYYTSSDGGATLSLLGSADSTTTATEFYDFDFCVCGELVPEPSSVALLGLGGIAMLFRRRR